MKIILRDNVDNLGDTGEVVVVKNGYARNFLIPRGLAYRASNAAMKIWEQEKKSHTALLAKETQEASALKSTLEADSVTVSVTVGEDEQVFGSVTNRQIADALSAKNYNIDRRQIIINEPIRSLDVHEVEVNLGHGVHAVLKVWAVPEEREVIAEDAVEDVKTEEKVEVETVDETATEPEKDTSQDGDAEVSEQPDGEVGGPT